MAPGDAGEAGGFAAEWAHLGTGLHALDTALARELDVAWSQLEAMLVEQAGSAQEVRDRLDELPPADHLRCRIGSRCART